jgi:hypothetical protein
MSEVLAGLPRRAAIHSGRYQWFHVPSAKWVEATSLSGPGAYRARSYTTLDLLRTSDDIQNGTVALSQVRLSEAGQRGARPAHFKHRRPATCRQGGKGAQAAEMTMRYPRAEYHRQQRS